MTVLALADGSVILEGACPDEDAETLLQHLTAAPLATVDLRRCASAHAAVIQVLMALNPKVLGPPPQSPAWRWIYPILESDKRLDI